MLLFNLAKVLSTTGQSLILTQQKYKRLKLQTRGSIAVTDQLKSKSDNHSLSSGSTVDQIDVVSTFTNTSSVFPKSKVNDINI